MPTPPWDHHPDLSLDRLQLISKVLIDTRREAVRQHDPAAGDTPWSLGCRVYARSAEMLARAAADLWPWLTVVSPPLEFIFGVGAVPMRFFHGDADHPDGQHLRIAAAEAWQLELAFGDGRVDLIWRICVETNVAGETVRAVLLGTTPAGDVQCNYAIPPLDGAVTFLTPRRTAVGPGVELPPPLVTARKDQQRQDDDDGADI